MDIRRATIADIDAITNLAGQLGYPADAAEMGMRLNQVLLDEAQDVYVAEAQDGQVIGWIHVFTTRQLVVEPYVEIGGLIVDEGHRGMGVGKALVEAAEKWTMEKGLKSMRVRSNTLREGAYPFYQHMGFTCIKTQYVFIKTLEEGSKSQA